MAIVALHQRAALLAENPANVQEIDDLAQDLRAAVVPNGEEGLVDEAFFFLAQGRQWLEFNQDNLVGRVDDDVRPPDPIRFERLIDPWLPLRHQSAPEQRGLAAPVFQPEPELPQVPAIAAPAQQNTLQRIWDAVSKAIKTVIEFIFSFLCCLPRIQTRQANAARQPAAQPQQQAQVQQPILQERVIPPPLQEPVLALPQQQVLPQQEQVVPNQQLQVAPPQIIAPVLLAGGAIQATGQRRGTINIGGVGGAAAAPYCAKELIKQLWDSLLARVDLFAGQQASVLIDVSLREGAAKRPADDNLAVVFPRIEPVVIDRLGDEQIYLRQIQLIEHHAAFRNPQRMAAAIVGKGDQCHVLLVDARDAERRYYHYNPHANLASLNVYENIRAINHDLTEALPIEAANPFAIAGYSVRAAE